MVMATRAESVCESGRWGLRDQTSMCCLGLLANQRAVAEDSVWVDPPASKQATWAHREPLARSRSPQNSEARRVTPDSYSSLFLSLHQPFPLVSPRAK